MTQHVPLAAPLASTSPNERVFRLPLGASAQFAALFEQLDADKAALGVDDYGLSVTTMGAWR